ncbi:MAG: hypothetical protein ACTSVB_09485, partial [Candidatus Heimdallarchaeaceae archaeon]
KLPNGVEELNEMEVAGGAILSSKEEPAFEGAKVLEIAMANMENCEDLVFASKYKEEDLITADYYQDEVRKNIEKLKQEKEEKLSNSEENKEETTTKIKCSNCGEELNLNLTPEYTQGSVKCSKCFAILNGQTGEMIYPPQIKNFRLSCPHCGANNWLILKETKKDSELKCLTCSKEFNIEYEVKNNDNPTDKEIMRDKLQFLYSGLARCYQCGNTIPISGTSKTKTFDIECDRCGLKFTYNQSQIEKNRKIIKVAEKIEENKKSSEEGGKENMKDKDNKEKISEEKIEKKEEVTKETSPEETKEITPKEKTTEAPQEETIKEKSSIDETKAEENPKETPKAEEPKEDKIQKDMDDFYAGIKKTENSKTWIEEEIEKFNCSCVECGHKITSTEHCVNLKCPKCGAQMRRTDRPGDGKPEEKKESKKLKKETRGKCVFQSDNPKVKDNGDHFPINDVNQARNALARVAQYDSVPKWYDGTLKELQTTVKNAVARAFPSVKVTKGKYSKTKSLRKAIKKIKDLIKSLEKAKVFEEKSETYKTGIKKVASQLIKANAEIKKIKLEADQKIKFYKENASEIHKRREELGVDFAKDLSDKDILDEDKFVKAKLEKENSLLRAKVENSDDVVGDKDTQRDNEFYSTVRNKINEIAYGKKEEKGEK